MVELWRVRPNALSFSSLPTDMKAVLQKYENQWLDTKWPRFMLTAFCDSSKNHLDDPLEQKNLLCRKFTQGKKIQEWPIVSVNDIEVEKRNQVLKYVGAYTNQNPGVEIRAFTVIQLGFVLRVCGAERPSP